MLTTLLLLLALLFALPAMADDNINFTLSVEPSSLTAPGPVTVSVRVVNAGETDMTDRSCSMIPAARWCLPLATAARR